MKKKITLTKHINPSIRVGDKVRMVDGSAFSYSGKQTESLLITQSYPELTGLNANIKNIDATVLAVNINNVATLSHVIDAAYITDIKLSIGVGEFFTCSKFVEKVEDVEEKKFPRMMLVWDGSNEESAVKMEVHAYVPTTPKPWIASRTRHGHAKEIPTPQFTYLTAQDISEGIGVGIDPKLIKFKE